MMPYNYFMPQQQQQFFPQQAQQNTMQIQNNGFIAVRTENEAFNYPVAPGNCVTFKVEGQPIVIEKSMGFSQLESPKIERYRLVKEDTPVASNLPQNEAETKNPINDTIDELKAEIEQIRADVDDLKTKTRQPVKKATVKGKDDDE